jgi:hypothetical protein
MERADGSVSENDLESIEGETVLADNELATLNLQKVLELLRGVAKQMREGSEKFMLKRISDDLPETQKRDARGEPFSAEVFFEALDSIWIDFEKDENPLDNLMWIVPPQMMPKIEEVMGQIESDPSLQRRLRDLMSKKKEIYREAEANRRLVG